MSPFDFELLGTLGNDETKSGVPASDFTDVTAYLFGCPRNKALILTHNRLRQLKSRGLVSQIASIKPALYVLTTAGRDALLKELDARWSKVRIGGAQ